MLRDLGSGDALVAELVVEVRVRLIEMVADFLKHRLRIGAEDRVLAALDERFVELGGIGHVEIPHDHEGARRPVAAAEVGMAGAFIELAAGAVAQVPHEDLAAEIKVLLDAIGAVLVQLALAVHLEEGFHLLAENLCQRVGFDPAPPVDVGFSERHIELHTADPGAVLAAVVLLFHEQEELVHPPQAGAVAVVIVCERLAEADGGDAAFVIKVVAQGFVNFKL